RAWSSPIWYTPSTEMQKQAKPGLTVEALKMQGAVPLDEAQLRALIVDKSTWLQNDVTGTKFKITYSGSGSNNATQTLSPIDPNYLTAKLGENQGQSQVNHVGNGAVQASIVGDVAEASYLGSTSPYYINDGKIVTVLAGTPIEVMP